MKNIYLVRHGETVWNKEKRNQGRSDSPLTDFGKFQAKTLGEKLKEVELDFGISSPLGRTISTMEIICENKNIPLSTDDRILELDFGPWEGKSKAEISDKVQSHNFRHKSHEFSVDGVETFDSLIKRTHEFMKELIQKDFKNALIVTHSIPIRSLLMIWDGRVLENFWSGTSPFPGSVSKVRFVDDNYLNGEIILYADLEYLI